MSWLIKITLIIAVVCIPLSAAIFTPAVGISLILLVPAGIFGFQEKLRESVLLLFFCVLSLLISPGLDLGKTDTLLIVFCLISFGFTGLYLGINKSRST